MESNVFIEFSNDELFSMVEELNKGSIIETSKLYDIAAIFYNLPKNQIFKIQLIGLGLPLSVELVKRVKELQKNLN